jgi:hypothetical protein
MSFIDEFIYRRGILLNSFVDPKEEELDTDDLEVALINESFEEQMKQSQLFYNSDLKSLFYNGGQTTTTALLNNNEQAHSQMHKDSKDSSLLIKLVPNCSPIRWPHITLISEFDDSERGRQLDMELGRMMLESEDDDDSTFINSFDESGSKSASITKYLDKSVESDDNKTEEAESYFDINKDDISKKLPSSLNSTSLLEQMAASSTPKTKMTPISPYYYNISSLTFLPYHHMAGGFFSSSSFESTMSQQEDEDTAAACADAAEAIAIDVVQSLFADEQYTQSELGITDDESEDEDDNDEEENNNIVTMTTTCTTTTAISPSSFPSSSSNNTFSSCSSSFCEINKTTHNTENDLNFLN